MHRSSRQPGFVDQMVGAGVSRSDRFFHAVGLVVNWEPIEAELAVIHSSPRGRPSHPPLMLFKTLVLQRWYDLSDAAAEDALNDRKSFARFVGLSLDQIAPDHTAICRFRVEIIRRGLMDRLMASLMSQIEAKNLVLKQGTLLDATLIKSAARAPSAPHKTAAAKSDETQPSQPPPADPYLSGKLSRLDPQARWARKGARAVFGYKLHIAVDDERRFVRAHAVTPANVNDCEIGPNLIQGDGGAHYGDKGYSSQPMRSALATRGLADGIMQLGNKHHPLPPAYRRRNRILSGLRCAVEGVFGEIKHRFGLSRTRYLGLAKVANECSLAIFAFNLKTLALAPT